MSIVCIVSAVSHIPRAIINIPKLKNIQRAMAHIIEVVKLRNKMEKRIDKPIQKAPKIMIETRYMNSLMISSAVGGTPIILSP